MKLYTTRLAFIVCVLTVLLSPAGFAAEHPVTAVQAFTDGPLSFEPNRGQFDAQFNFATTGANYGVFLNSAGLKLKVRSLKTSKCETLDMALQQANPTARMRAVDHLQGEANYFYGAHENWITHVPTFKKVIVEDVYRGIDAVYYGNQSRVEYDFIIKPGASPSTIDIRFAGASRVRLTQDGDLAISVGDQEILQPKPTLYQDVDGQRVSVEGGFVLRGESRVGFEVGEYDRAKALVIDPQLVFARYLSSVRLYGIAVDPLGNIYAGGATPDGGPNDQATSALVAKWSSTGALMWKNAFGTVGFSDSVAGVAVDAFGNLYVAGSTFHSAPPFLQAFPLKNALQSTPGGADAFITKFDTSGQMVYSTLLGGHGSDAATGIAVDSLGNIYVTGTTSSTDFPTSKPCQVSLHGGTDAFVAVLNAQGSALIYSTYVGGSADDQATGIAVDATGDAYVTGFTSSTDFPTSNPIRGTSGGGVDAFALKLNAAGSALMYSTYIGGAGADRAHAIAIDGSNNAYLVGITNSSNFPTVSAYQPQLAGATDAFVTKINSSGTSFGYSTYLGGSAAEKIDPIWCDEKPTCGGIAVTKSGNAFVTGVTRSTNFPQVRSIQSFTGISQAFITEFASDGASLVFSTFLGGAIDDNSAAGPAVNLGTAIALDANANVFVAGISNARDFPMAADPNSPSSVNQVWNGFNAFIAKLVDVPPTATSTRVEQNNAAVQYSGQWYVDTHSWNSGGSATTTPGAGARATFTFNGTAVKWIGFKDPWSGIAKVYVDGAFKAQVDTYSATDQRQAVIYSVSGLASGAHTFRIEVTGMRNASALSSWVWIDAFEYTPGTTPGGDTGGGSAGGGPTGTFTRVEQNNSAVQYAGQWYVDTHTWNSSGSAVVSMTAGARATFTFNGTAAKWIGYKDPWSGIAKVYVDGAFKADVDTYSATGQIQAPLFSVSGLASGSHTLTIEVTGTKNASAKALWVWIDAFESTSGTTSGGAASGGNGTFTRVEQNNAAVQYAGQWNVDTHTWNSNGSAVATMNAGARATFTFTGTAVRWIGYKDPWSGIANVYVDGVLKVQIDTYATTDQIQAVLYSTTGLSAGSHTLTIEVTGTRNSSAKGLWVWIDAFESM
jgi:Beta-propeller repeat